MNHNPLSGAFAGLGYASGRAGGITQTQGELLRQLYQAAEERRAYIRHLITPFGNYVRVKKTFKDELQDEIDDWLRGVLD